LRELTLDSRRQGYDLVVLSLSPLRQEQKRRKDGAATFSPQGMRAKQGRTDFNLIEG
jgi:hypothetical protein